MRGQERKDLVKEIIADYNGSAKNWCETMKGRGEDPPSQDVVRKILSDQQYI